MYKKTLAIREPLEASATHRSNSLKCIRPYSGKALTPVSLEQRARRVRENISRHHSIQSNYCKKDPRSITPTAKRINRRLRRPPITVKSLPFKLLKTSTPKWNRRDNPNHANLRSLLDSQQILSLKKTGDVVPAEQPVPSDIEKLLENIQLQPKKQFKVEKKLPELSLIHI